MTTTLIDGPVGHIAVHELAESDAEAVLVVAHATGFLGRVYAAFARELSDVARVVALDFRGHGDSVTPENPDDFAWGGMADDLAAVIEFVDPKTLHGFGHSMGGAALLEVEHRTPGTFVSVLVFEPIVPPGRFSDNGESPLMRAARGRIRAFPSRAEALQRYASKPPLGLLRADVLNDYVLEGFADTADGITLKCLPESEATTFGNAGTISLSHLGDIELDVVVGRSGDGGFPALLAEPVADALPNGRVLDFPTIGHFGPLQEPNSVARAMADLIATTG